MRLRFAVAALLGLGCEAAPALDLPAADAMRPPPARLSRLATAGLDTFLGASARLGFHAGYVVALARDGRVVHTATTGWSDREARVPMRPGTRFRIASMTKPITAVAALILIEEGRLALRDPVSAAIPAAAKLRVATSTAADASGRIPSEPLERPLTVRDLVTFRAGIGGADDASDLGRLWAERDVYSGSGPLAGRVERILEAPLYEQPGTRWRYGWSSDVLARVVEVTAGEPFGRFVARRITGPLGMQSTHFLSEPEPGARDALAAMYTQDAERRLVRVETPKSDAIDWTPGGSGLVSTAGDYLRFALMLWNGGSYDGVRILSRETVAEMTRPQVTAGVLADRDIEGLGWGLGVAVVVDAEATPMPDRDGDFFWSGYYGTHFTVSPSTGLVVVALTQNQPSAYSRLPYAIHLAQGFAFWGL